MLKTLKTIRMPARIRQRLLHGLIIIITLSVIQILLDNYQNGFMVFLPPIGFGLFLALSYVIQPIIIGALNVIILCHLYKTEGCQTGFWLNGLFLLLTFSTINLLLLTVWSVTFTVQLAAIEVFTLAIPFGYLGRFSNRGWKRIKTNQEQTSER